MASSALRGSGLGTKSLEDEKGVEMAPRIELGFVCPSDHTFAVTFSSEAELPTEWGCPRCGGTGIRADGTKSEFKDDKPQRTHWDMLLERRSIPELEALLKERLKEVRKERLY